MEKQPTSNHARPRSLSALKPDVVAMELRTGNESTADALFVLFQLNTINSSHTSCDNDEVGAAFNLIQ
jgi:hypothetical protein